MITREEYIIALNVVETYHIQLNSQIVKCSFSKIKDLSETDLVEVVEVNVNTSKNLTVGKKYQILRFSADKYYFTIIADNGKEMQYVTDYGKTFKPAKKDFDLLNSKIELPKIK